MAAPVLLLIAVIAFVAIVVNSGVVGGENSPSNTPTVQATHGGSTNVVTKKYVVHAGDSLSSIAQRFDTTVGELQRLNPDLGGSTLVVGQRIVVPR